MKHHALEIFNESFSKLSCRCPRTRRHLPEFGIAWGQCEPLALHEISIAVESYEEEVTVVSDQDLLITFEVTANLFALSDRVDVIRSWLDFNRATRRKLTLNQFTFRSFLKLIGCEQPTVRQTCSFVRNVNEAADARLKTLAYFIEEIRKCSVAGRFRHASA